MLKGNFYRVFISENLAEKLSLLSAKTGIDVDYLASFCIAAGFSQLAVHLDVDSTYHTKDCELFDVCSRKHDISDIKDDSCPYPHFFGTYRM